MTMEEYFDRGLVSVYDPVLDEMVRFASYSDYLDYKRLLEKVCESN